MGIVERIQADRDRIADAAIREAGGDFKKLKRRIHFYREDCGFPLSWDQEVMGKWAKDNGQ